MLILQIAVISPPIVQATSEAIGVNLIVNNFLNDSMAKALSWIVFDGAKPSQSQVDNVTFKWFDPGGQLVFTEDVDPDKEAVAWSFCRVNQLGEWRVNVSYQGNSSIWNNKSFEVVPNHWGPGAFNVTRTTLVSFNSTLTIEPGTTVRFDEGKSLGVEGKLIAQGTEQDPIIFTSNLTTKSPGDWSSITFFESADNLSVFDHVKVEYSREGLTLQSTSLYVANSTFVNNRERAIYAVSSNSSFINNHISRGDEGISPWGIYSAGSNLTVKNNIIQDMYIGLYFINSNESRNATMEMEDNLVEDCNSYGMLVKNSILNSSNDEFVNNKKGVQIESKTDAIFEKLTITGGSEGFTASFNSSATLWNSSVEDVQIATFILRDDSTVILINCSFSTSDSSPGVSIDPTESSILVVRNFLTVETKSFDNGSQISDALVGVYDGMNLIYQVNTDVNGLTQQLIVTDRIYMPTLIENITWVHVSLGDLSFQNNNRSVAMDESHTEIFLGSINDFNETDTVPPFVVSHYPTEDETVLNIVITITFSEPMENNTVEDNFSILPYVAGTFAWAGNTFIFIPQSLVNNTFYTVTIDKGAKDLANNSLPNSYQFSFKTLNVTDTSPPNIIDTYPTGNEVDVDISYINITFNEEMQTYSTEPAFSINPRIPGIFSWEGNTLRFRPIFELSEKTTYTVSMNGSRARDTAGNTLDGNANGTSEGSPLDDYVWQFETKRIDFTSPVIHRGYPTGNMVDRNALIRIYFSEHMNKTSVEQAFSYTNGTKTWTSANGSWGASVYVMTFIPSEPFDYSQVYTVTIDASAKDLLNNTLDGNANGTAEGSPIDDYKWSFKSIYDPEIGLPSINDVYPLGSGIDVDTEISVNFSQTMNQNSVEDAFTITDGVTTWDKSHGTFVWEGNRTYFIPSITFDYNTTYIVRINITAENIVTSQLDGNENGIPEDFMIDAYTFNFTTYAPIELVPTGIKVNGNDASDPGKTWYVGPGEMATITANVKNIGYNTTVTSFLLSLYNVTGPFGGKIPSDEAFNYTINPLSQNEVSGDMTWNWKVPMQSGNYYVNISADYGDDISELVEGNNSFTLHIAVKPDLTVNNVTIDGISISAYPHGVVVPPGQIITIGSNIRNIGESSTGILEFNMSFWNSTETGVNLGNVLEDVGPLGPLQADSSSATQYIIWKAPRSTKTEYYFINISADSNDIVSEVDEVNNIYILHIIVNAPDLAPDLVELKVASTGSILEIYADPIGMNLVSSPILLPPNIDLRIIFDAINLGGVNQSLGTNAILYNTTGLGGEPLDPPFFESSQELINLSAFGLPQDQTSETGQTVIATWNNPGVEGMYYVNISMDPENKVNELNESNNIFVLVINVSAFKITTINAIGTVYYGVEWYFDSSTQLNLSHISGTPPIYTWYRILNHDTEAVLLDWTNYTGNTSFMLTFGEGNFEIEYNSTDANFKEETMSRGVMVENQPPLTTIDIGEPQYNDSSSDVVNISAETPLYFYALDFPLGVNAEGVNNASGIYSPTKPESGIFVKIWSVDLDDWITGWQKYMPNTPFYLSNSSWAEGLYEIHFNATDNLGNKESTNISLVYLDNRAPTINIAVGTPNWTLGGVRVNVSSLTQFSLLSWEDSGSGTRLSFYRIFNEDSNLYVGNWIEGVNFMLSSILTDGNYTIEFFTTDNVLNTGAIDFLYVFLDNSPPESLITISLPKYRLRPSDEWTVAKDTYFTLQGHDIMGSGIENHYYSILNDTGYMVVSSQIYTGQFNLSGLGGDGQYTIRFWAKDNLNNTEPLNEIKVTFDIVLPQILFVIPTGSGNAVYSYFQLLFSEDMDHDSLKAAFSYTDGIEIWDHNHGFFNWDRNIMTFYPYENLSYGTSYQVMINTSATDNVANRLDGNGNGSYEGQNDIFIWNFSTIEIPDDEPPTIVYVIPSENSENVHVDEEIVIEFSEIMDELSVEAAFSLRTDMRTFHSDSGIFTWMGNKTIFTPKEPFKFDTEYTVTISDSARDFSGNFMAADYSWHFQTRKDYLPPNILDYSPMGDNVSINTFITISFDEPMNTDITESAFIIIPFVNGTLAWDENTLFFIPDNVLDYGTTYYVQLGIEAKDAAGNSIGSPFQFSFICEPDIYPPQVIGHTPSGMEIDIYINITVIFNEEMDKASVEEYFLISPDAEGNFSWIGNTFIFTPMGLTNFTTYSITIGAKSKDLAGNMLSAPYQFSFKTKEDPYSPFVVEVEPTGVDVPVDSVIRIVFSEKMNLSSLYGAFKIGPYMPGTLSLEDDVLIFTPNGKFAINTIYNVTILGTAKDEAGNPMLSEYSWDFETEKTAPSKSSPIAWDLLSFALLAVIITVVLVLIFYQFYLKKRKQEGEKQGEDLDSKYEETQADLEEDLLGDEETDKGDYEDAEGLEQAIEDLEKDLGLDSEEEME
jgi:hypothetical protein